MFSQGASIQTVTVLLACGALVASEAAASSDRGPAQITKPPRVVLEGQAGELRMKRGSYCSQDGCVDTPPPRTERNLKVAAGERVRLLIGASAETVGVFRANGRRYATASRRLSLAGVRGEEWEFTVSPKTKPDVNLVVFVHYQPSAGKLVDAYFGGRIAEH